MYLQIFTTRNYILFKISAWSLFLKYLWFPNFSFDILIKYILIEKKECSCSLCTCLWSLCWRRCPRGAQGHPTTVFCKISVRRSKNGLEFSITRGRLTISRWPFHSCTIFEVYLSLIFRIPIPRFSTLRAVVSPGRTLRFDTVPQPDLLSSLSRIPFSSTILFLMSRFWGIHLLSSGQIPYPLNKFCVIPNPSPYFGSNRGSRDTPSRPCLWWPIYFGISAPPPPPASSFGK